MSKVDAIKQVNTIWGAESLEQDQRGPPTAEGKLELSSCAVEAVLQPDSPPGPLRSIRPLKAHIHLLPRSLSESEYEERARQGRGDAQPLLLRPLSLSGGRTGSLLGYLINANYVRAVINLGTPVLADENKTITFSPCECQQQHH